MWQQYTATKMKSRFLIISNYLKSLKEGIGYKMAFLKGYGEYLTRPMEVRVSVRSNKVVLLLL
jgi:hypothetical protein